MVDVSLKKIAAVGITKPQTLEEEVKDLRLKLDSMSKMFLLIRQDNEKKNKKALIVKKDELDNILNKEGIPVNTFYLGYIENTAFPHILIVNDKGKYIIGDKLFDTLADSAEFITGIKQDGKAFWQTIQGVFLKEIYK